MGFISRRVVPRSVRRAVHPVRTAKNAATRAVVPPKVRSAYHMTTSPVSTAWYRGVERPLGEALSWEGMTTMPAAKRPASSGPKDAGFDLPRRGQSRPETPMTGRAVDLEAWLEAIGITSLDELVPLARTMSGPEEFRERVPDPSEHLIPEVRAAWNKAYRAAMNAGVRTAFREGREGKGKR